MTTLLNDLEADLMKDMITKIKRLGEQKKEEERLLLVSVITKMVCTRGTGCESTCPIYKECRRSGPQEDLDSFSIEKWKKEVKDKALEVYIEKYGELSLFDDVL